MEVIIAFIAKSGKKASVRNVSKISRANLDIIQLSNKCICRSACRLCLRFRLFVKAAGVVLDAPVKVREREYKNECD